MRIETEMKQMSYPCRTYPSRPNVDLIMMLWPYSIYFVVTSSLLVTRTQKAEKIQVPASKMCIESLTFTMAKSNLLSATVDR